MSLIALLQRLEEQITQTGWAERNLCNVTEQMEFSALKQWMLYSLNDLSVYCMASNNFHALLPPLYGGQLFFTDHPLHQTLDGNDHA
jgi:hypothetical protein